MLISVVYMLVVITAVLFITYLKKQRDTDKKLQWVHHIPGIPLLGNVLEFNNPTTMFLRSEKHLLENNGLCTIRLLSRTFVLISDYKFLEWLLSSTTILDKSIDYQFLYRWLEDGILTTNGSKWKKDRKILTPTFHFTILEKFAGKFDKPGKILVDLLNKEVGKESVDVQSLITNFTLDVICETAMGVEINAQQNPKSEYVKAVQIMCKTVFERTFNPLKTNDFTYRFTLTSLAEKKAVKYLHATCDTVLKMKRQKQEEGIDEDDDEIEGKKRIAFLDLLLKYRDEFGQPLSDKFIREQVNTIMFAGHDTTASALCFTLHCLSNHTYEQEKAFKEIKDISQENDKFTYRNLQDMKYLELIVKESLRLYPSVPFYSRRLIKDIAYEGTKMLPKDVTLLICAYAINRNPKVFKEPDKFIPSRFVEADLKPFSYLPFSAGPRNCIGQKFAMLEMKVTLAKILWNFEVLPTDPEHKPIISAETVLISKNGFKFKFKKRIE